MQNHQGRRALPRLAVVREAGFGALVFAVSLGLLVVRFMVPRPIGLTDNGDGWRLTCQVGAFTGPWAEHPFVQFAYGAGNDCVGVLYPASQIELARVAIWIGQVVGTESMLNVLILGLLGCLIAAAAITTVVLGLPFAPRYRVIGAALILLLLADSAFFGYLPSVVTEGPAFLGIVLLVGGLLLMCRAGRWRYAGAAVIVFGGIFAVNAKVQTLMILPLLLVALLLVRREGDSWRSRLVLALTVFTAVASVTAVYQSAKGGWEGATGTGQINMYNTVFNSIVDGKHDTVGDLAALGLPPSYARYVGTRYWSAGSAPNIDPTYEQYHVLFNRDNISRYYLSHPARTAQILQHSATELLLTRPDYLGSFAENAGFPTDTKEYRVPVISSLLRVVAPLGLFFLVPLWLAIGWAGVRALRNDRREFGIVVLFLLSIALGQFVLAALGEGIEGVKHQIIAAFCTVLAGLLTVISLFPRQPADRVSEESSGTVVEHEEHEEVAAVR